MRGRQWNAKIETDLIVVSSFSPMVADSFVPLTRVERVIRLRWMLRSWTITKPQESAFCAHHRNQTFSPGMKVRFDPKRRRKKSELPIKPRSPFIFFSSAIFVKSLPLHRARSRPLFWIRIYDLSSFHLMILPYNEKGRWGRSRERRSLVFPFWSSPEWKPRSLKVTTIKGDFWKEIAAINFSFSCYRTPTYPG